MIPVIPLSFEIILSIGLGLIILVLIAWLVRLELRITKLTDGTNHDSLEGHIKEINTRSEKLITYTKQARVEREALRSHIEQSIRGMHTVRFDPYGEGRGKQSFATALVDENANGVVLSSLYSRERCRMFAKPIHEGTSQHELSKEEQEALTEATKKIIN